MRGRYYFPFGQPFTSLKLKICIQPNKFIILLAMNPNSKLIVYGMIGPMGSGKTTLALKIAKETGALFQSLDGTIKSFNEPIGDLAGYERLMPKALDLMYTNSLNALKNERDVVFDVARWPWLMDLANEVDANIQIYHFNISTEERWRRVQKRNHEKIENVYHFTMSKEEFDRQDPRRNLPSPMPGLTLIEVT